MDSLSDQPMLIVDFAGALREVRIGETLSFGREADLSIDTNPYLHRRLGDFRYESGAWWLYNTGTAIMLEVADTVSASRMSIAPGAAVPLAFEQSLLRFQAGAATYELALLVEGVSRAVPMSNADGPLTVTPSKITLNEEQYLLLLALAEPRLRDPLAARDAIPTNRRAAERLGWSMPKFNRKLDNLCTKLDRLGVRGLKGDVAGLATNRREALVDYVLRVRRVTFDDLNLLDERP